MPSPTVDRRTKTNHNLLCPTLLCSSSFGLLSCFVLGVVNLLKGSRMRAKRRRKEHATPAMLLLSCRTTSRKGVGLTITTTPFVLPGRLLLLLLMAWTTPRAGALSGWQQQPQRHDHAPKTTRRRSRGATQGRTCALHGPKIISCGASSSSAFCRRCRRRPHHAATADGQDGGISDDASSGVMSSSSSQWNKYCCYCCSITTFRLRTALWRSGSLVRPTRKGRGSD